MAFYEKEYSIRGFHIFKDVWTPVEGEILDTSRERNNPYDKYAVAVKKEQITVGHVPREISKTVAFFMKHGGIVTCKVTSGQYRHSLIAGGLEIPCTIRFTADPAMIERLKSLL